MPATAKSKTSTRFATEQSVHSVSFAGVNYATGGVALTFDQLDFAAVVLVVDGLDGYTTRWDSGKQKLKIFNTDRASAAAQAGQEIANGTSLNAFTDVRLFVG